MRGSDAPRRAGSPQPGPPTGWSLRVGLPALLLLLWSAPGGAEQDPELPYATRGVVLGLSGSVALPTSLEDQLEVVNDVPIRGFDVTPSVGLHARLGYRAFPRLSAELHYELVSPIGIDVADGGRPGDPEIGADPASLATAGGYTLTGDLKAYILTGPIQPFAVVGVGAMWITTRNKSQFVNDEHRVVLNIEGVDTSSFAARFGVGADFYLAEHFALVIGASYVLPTGNLRPYDYLSVEWGLQYRF